MRKIMVWEERGGGGGVLLSLEPYSKITFMIIK
jgi:hypothetical protein